MKLKVILIFISGGILSLTGNAQKVIPKPSTFTPTEIWEAGLPFIKNFTSDDYGENPQNWAFIEGDDGLMYIANTSGVIEYDGNDWRLIPIKNNSIIRSLAKADDGKIYVGGVGEFGYLKKDSLGENQYFSLSKKLKKTNKNFNEINSIVVLNGLVFFQCHNFLFRWDGNKIKIWKPKESFGTIYKVYHNIYIQSKGVGILTLRDENLKLIANGKYFENLKGRISLMAPFQKDKILLGHSKQGFFIYDDGDIRIFNDNANNTFKQTKISSGKRLANGNYIIGTYSSGVFIINGITGNIIKKYGVDQGILSDVIYAIYQASSDGAIWIGCDLGFSRVDLMKPIRKFNDVNGIRERVRSVMYDGNTLYVASKGVYYLKKNAVSKNIDIAKFKKIENIDENVRHIIPIASHKLVVNGENIIDLNENNFAKIVKNDEVHRFALKSKVYPNRVYISANKGNIYQFDLINSLWKSKVIANVKTEVVKITEEASGDLWLSTYYKGIYKIKKEKGDNLLNIQYSIKNYDTISGLPTMDYNSVFYLNKKLYVSNQNFGLYKFNTAKNLFEKDTIIMNQYHHEKIDAYGPLVGDGSEVLQTVGFNGKSKIYRIKKSKISELKELNIYSDFMTFNINVVDSIVFFSGPKGILAYNQNLKKPKVKLPNVQLRKVQIKGDSLVYAGLGGVMNQEFNYNRNAMRFTYSLPFFTKPKETSYQHILEGFDNTWSSWSKETKKDYTNLPEGTYTFRVRAKNIFGNISREDRYTFTILAPWYRTWWAYLTYLLMAGFTIWLFAQWQNKRLAIKNLVLAQMVDDRTTQVKEKNEQLERQTERLKELDKMKTRLFANISHEFRTPLTLIKGPIDNLEQAQKNAISTTNIKMIRRNANRLLNLVNQLLDLSKLESGQLQLNTSEGDVFKRIRVAATSFSSLAAQRNIDYHIKISKSPLWASFDRDIIEKIVYNLLSNAFKFTNDGGKITVEARYLNNQLIIKISDEGCGIKKEQLFKIFDRFYQVDDSFTKEKAGSGIGLSLTKELVDLMQGEIYVESELGKGSIFKVRLPLQEIITHQQKIMEGDAPDNLQSHDMAETAIVTTDKTKHAHKILIIEDNSDMRHFIKEQLVKSYEVFEATNGKEGLRDATRHQPDLIITDLMMPKMDGITLCKRLKMDINTSHIPIVMLTAKAGIENKLEGLETGADDYLTKPFNVRELSVRVHNLIKQRTKLRELFSATTSIHPKEITVNSLDQQFLEKVIELLESRHSDPEFGVPQMQEYLGMSKTQLHCKLKALTNHPPGELLRNFRLERAAQLLLQHGDNISQIAYTVGFNSLSYFTKCFKKYFKKSPSEYMNEQP